MLPIPVRVAELHQRCKNIRHKEPLSIVRRKLHDIAPVLPEWPLVLSVLQVVRKPGSSQWKGLWGYYADTTVTLLKPHATARIGTMCRVES